SDHRHLSMHQLGCEFGQFIQRAFRPAVLDLDILTFSVSNGTKTSHEGIYKRTPHLLRPGVQISDGHHLRLLPARCEWPCRGRQAGEQGDELSALHSMSSSARASSIGGRVRPSALAALRLITSSNFVGACTGKSAGFAPLRTRST